MAYIAEEFAPVAEPLGRTEVKNYLKVPQGVTSDDAFIDEAIQAAREEVEGYTGRSILNKGYVQVLDAFPYFVDTVMSQLAYPPSYYSLPRYSTTLWNYSQMIKLLRSPLQAVTKITFTDSVTQQIQALFPQLFPWQPLHEYFISDDILDSNGNLQVVTGVTEGDEDSTSMSGQTQPTWATGVGATTGDSMLTWTCQGVPASAGDFIYDAISCPPRIFPLVGQTWPPVLYVPNAVQIHFIAGYGNDGKGAPAALRQAMRLLISDAYYNRDLSIPGAIAKNPAYERLLYRWKVQIRAATRG
jgi:hypothetical protein